MVIIIQNAFILSIYKTPLPPPPPSRAVSSLRILGGILIAGPAPTPFLIPTLTTSTLALARAIAGTTHSPQLHGIPAQANLPRLAPQLVFGHDRRPERGESEDGSGSGAGTESDSRTSALLASGSGGGNSDGFIHLRG